MLAIRKGKRFLRKSSPLVYFVIYCGLPKSVREAVVVLFTFVKTVSGYIDKRPVHQDAYFDFKDRYHKALLGSYLLDHFIAEDYVLLWRYLEQGQERTYPWQDWTETFFATKNQDLVSVSFDTQEQLDAYLKGYGQLGCIFGVLVGWSESTYDVLTKVFCLVKHASLLLHVAEDSSFGRRYLPLLDSQLVSISTVELIKKPLFYKKLIHDHLAVERDRIYEIERELTKLDSSQRALICTILYAVRYQSKKIEAHPEYLFTHPISYFQVSLGRLAFKRYWYSLKGMIVAG